ncbi:hypothetical protein ACFQAT_28055 [Undibacterium arcticum]|uniref:Uncharacterized protein n=1 Tax=Undibacterium arcticum TaxID=1762892 RepID=A0ABV7F3F1_9BURK
MRDIAKEAYEKTSVGGVGWMRPDAAKGETVDAFQNVTIAARAMASDGLIHIIVEHLESQSGKGLIDAIQFRRIN